MTNEFYPFEIDTTDLTYGSGKRVNVHCGSNVSPICLGVKELAYNRALKALAKNDGTYICRNCTMFLQRGRNHPCCKYKTLDDNLMKTIDSEEKAYFLGWIASDGFIGKTIVTITIHKKDNKIIEILRDIVCKELPIKY